MHTGLAYNNDAYTIYSHFSAPFPMARGEGSFHIQDFQSIPTPYDKWAHTLEKGLPNDKQGNALSK